VEHGETRGLYRLIPEDHVLNNGLSYSTESIDVCIARSGVPAAMSQWGRLSASWRVLMSFGVPTATLFT